MDKEILVRNGHELVRLLDQTAIKPRAAMWVHNPDNDIWRLWIVAQDPKIDKNEFFRLVAESITKNRNKFPDLDIGNIELVKDTHPAMAGMKGMLRMEGLGSANFSNNRMNGFYLPDGIVLRMTL